MRGGGHALVLAALAAVAAVPLVAGAQRNAATSCADPALPPAILDGAAAAHASPERTIRVAAPNGTLELAVADTEKRREKGLMCVTALRRDAGMVFVFEKSGEYVFWMKDTLVPLDMLWVEADGRVTAVAARVPASTLNTPEDEVAQRSGRGRFVIELRAGDAARSGIGVGTRLDLPRLTAQ